MKYYMTCYDKGHCDYFEYETTANGFTHALQRLAAVMPDEEPDHIFVYALPEDSQLKTRAK